MTLVEGEELQRLWSLVSELSSQLSANRELCQSLQAQADELKGQALHTGTGYTLRRFNLDVSKEKFESELEKLNSQLVLENQSLSHENKQINLLLREYEAALESVMSKFRSFSHSTQQHTLQLTSHYETLLANDMHQSESASLHASTSYSNTLAHLGGLLRLALREIGGEGEDDDGAEDDNADSFESEGYRVGSPSGGSRLTISVEGKQQKKIGSKTGYGSAPSRDPRWYGTGGYTGLQGDPEAEKADRALEAMTEEERLRKENETLRELLRVSADITPEVAREFGIEIPAPPSAAGWTKEGIPGAHKLSLGKPRGSRKSLGEIVPPIKTEEINHDEGSAVEEEEEEPSDVVVHNDSAPPISPSSSMSTGAIAAEVLQVPAESIGTSPGTIDHVVQGAGGPPQLTSEILSSSHAADNNASLISQDQKPTPLEALLDTNTASDSSRPQPLMGTELDVEKETVSAPLASQGEVAREELLEEVEHSIAKAAVINDTKANHVP